MPYLHRKITKKPTMNQDTASKSGAPDDELHEWRLQETDYPSTFAYHEHRERAPHLEQSWQNARIYKAAKLIRLSGARTVVDLGCGDGGLLSVVQSFGIECWGYDFCPANALGWVERGVRGELRDVFNDRPDDIRWGDLAVATEVLEHLSDPHGTVEWIAQHSPNIVASSPWGERPNQGTCDSHIWAWDMEGYAAMIGKHFEILDHRKVEWSQ